MLKLLLIFCALSPVLAENTKVAATHPQVIKVIDQMSKIYSWPVSGQKAIDLKGSPHSYKPSMKDLKNLMGLKFLVAGPTKHQKWLLKAKSQLPKKTHFLAASSSEHFWLNTDEACKREEEIVNLFIKWKLVKEYQGRKNKWCLSLKERMVELKNALHEQRVTHVILAHNALEAQLKKMGFKVLVLLDDDHHSEITSSVLKKALSWQSTKKIKEGLLQVKEPEIYWPSPLNHIEIRSISWSPLSDKPLMDFVQAIAKDKK